MDNLTHSLVGAALAEAGPRDRIALATPTLILAANVPDVDILAYAVGGEFAALAWRRGITHGVPALLVWPFVVAGLMIAWDRLVRSRRAAPGPPVSAASPTAGARARFTPLLALAAIGALSHPALDWLNTYGMRWWMPFDPAWSYGDAVFIIDPWLWLGLGGVVFLARSERKRSVAAWAGLALILSLPVLGVGMVPPAARVLWIGGLAILAAARWRARRPDPQRRRRAARLALGGAAIYIGAMIAVTAAAVAGVAGAAAAVGLEPVDIMTGPLPADPLGRDVIVATPDAYLTGTWRWGGDPRLRLWRRIPIRLGPAAALDAAVEDPRARDFLVWSRYPFFHASETATGWRVRIGDARYEGRGLGGLEVDIPFPDASVAAGTGDPGTAGGVEPDGAVTGGGSPGPGSSP